MDNDSDFFPLPWDPQRLLHEEVRILASRVDALIKWTEEFEDQIIFFGKSGGAGRSSKEESPSKVPKLPGKGGGAEGNFEGVSKPEDKQAEGGEQVNHGDEEDVIEEGVEPVEQIQSGEQDGGEEIDLFGASTSFADFKVDFTQQQVPPSAVPASATTSTTNKVSFLQFD